MTLLTSLSLVFEQDDDVKGPNFSYFMNDFKL